MVKIQVNESIGTLETPSGLLKGRFENKWQ
jgi:hypothetical protein